MIENIPVKVNGTRVGDYELIDLFCKFGNGDGDDGLLCAIADEVIAKVEGLGYEISNSGTIHNNHLIWDLKRNGKIVWDDDDYYNEAAMTDDLWQSLPQDVKELFEKLAEEGINLTL